MKFGADTAILDEIIVVKEMGLLGMVTTNPSLMAKAGVTDFKAYIEEICRVAGSDVPVNLEVVGLETDEMVEQGLKLMDMFNGIAGNVCVKIPASTATEKDTYNNCGADAIYRLSQQGVPVTSTLVFTPEQGITLASAGARYLAPFAGRIDDYLRVRMGWKAVKENPGNGEFTKSDYYSCQGYSGVDDNGIVSGVHLVEMLQRALTSCGYTQVQVLPASLRNAKQVKEVELTGVNVATIPPNVIKEIHNLGGLDKIAADIGGLPRDVKRECGYGLGHHKTVEGVNAFVKDTLPEYRAIFN